MKQGDRSEAEYYANIIDPMDYLEKVVSPNVEELILSRDDFRLSVNAILSIDSFVGVIYRYNSSRDLNESCVSDDGFRSELARLDADYRIARDLAAALKHGSLTRKCDPPRQVSKAEDLVELLVGAGTLMCGYHPLGARCAFIQAGGAYQSPGLLCRRVELFLRDNVLEKLHI